MILRSLALCSSLLYCYVSARPSGPDGSPRIPPVHGTTFSNVRVDLPDALNGKIGVLIVSFTQGSREGVTSWGKKLAADYYDSPSVLYYEMPMLASVPKFMRSFVEGRIKASVSDRGKTHFLPITEDEAEWRGLTHYSVPDDPYILLVDDHGIIRWQTQGAPTDATYALLKQQVETFVSTRSK